MIFFVSNLVSITFVTTIIDQINVVYIFQVWRKYNDRLIIEKNTDATV